MKEKDEHPTLHRTPSTSDERSEGVISEMKEIFDSNDKERIIRACYDVMTRQQLAYEKQLTIQHKALEALWHYVEMDDKVAGRREWSGKFSLKVYRAIRSCDTLDEFIAKIAEDDDKSSPSELAKAYRPSPQPDPPRFPEFQGRHEHFEPKEDDKSG